MDSYLRIDNNRGTPSRPVWVVASGYPRQVSVVNNDWMIDETNGNRETPNHAESRTARVSGKGYNLSGQNNAKRASAVNYVPAAWRWTWSNGKPSMPGLPEGAFHDQPSNNAAVLEALAVSNPSFDKNDVLLPVSLLELRELPKMVWDRANKLGKQTNSSVEYNFGWAPLISDIRKLFSFPATMERRLQTLNGLVEGGTNRQTTVYRGHAYSTKSPRVVESAWYPVYPIAYSQQVIEFTREMRVAVRWESNLPKALGDEDYARIAARLALGLDPSQFLQNLWEALPWSWLIDYFYDMSGLIAAYNRAVARPTRISLSTVTEAKVTEKVTAGPVGPAKPYTTTIRVWQRLPMAGVPAVPDLQMPILSAQQTVTLASIAMNNRA